MIWPGERWQQSLARHPSSVVMPREHAYQIHGFTLIELLVVLTILGLATAVGVPMLFGSADRAALRAAVVEVAAGLRETRSLALAGGRSAAFTLDTARRVYRVSNGSAWRALPTTIQPTLFTATREQLDAVTGDIRFFPDGSSTGGAVHLAQGKAEDEILVDWLTGRVSVAPPANTQPLNRDRLHAH
jgi:general secretion pathway protein H